MDLSFLDQCIAGVVLVKKFQIKMKIIHLHYCELKLFVNLIFPTVQITADDVATVQ